MITKKQIINFWNNVVKQDNGCWEHQGCLRKGYPTTRIRLNGTNILWATHRLSWTIINRVIPEDMWVLHRCDNPKCCNPEHLFLGTHQDNVDDMNTKGRGKHSFSDPEIQKINAEKAKLPDAIYKKKNTNLVIQHQQGNKNSQFGTYWIKNEEQNYSKKVTVAELDRHLLLGWVKGRIRTWQMPNTRIL